MADDMLDTDYLFQPRGPGTGWCFRMATPPLLVGRQNPLTGRPYGTEIRAGLKTRSLPEARKLRDARLGQVRAEEALALAERNGDVEAALETAQYFRSLDDDDVRETVSAVLDETGEKMVSKGADPAMAGRWVRIAKGKALPFKTALEAYLKDDGATLEQSTKNNLNTASREFRAFAGEEVTLQEVDRRLVGQFVAEYLPAQKSPKAPDGQSPATIRKKVSQLAQVWTWAMKRGHLPFSRETPWHGQAPAAKAVKAAATKRKAFEPEQARKLLHAAPIGTTLGDVIRVALMNGVRLEEVAGLKADQVEPEGRWYEITDGKTDNAARIVPLVDEAQAIILRRLKKPGADGSLFPELKVRKSTGKVGGAVSQEFTRLRREVLGKETDGTLVLHAFRHTWRTEARRAGVPLEDARDLGGWSNGKGAENVYDHRLQAEQYRDQSRKVVDHMRARGFLPPLP